MKISVVIPTYERLDLLKEAIRSVWEQTILPDEILIGDDSKDDSTEKFVMDEIIPKSPVVVRYFHHKPSLKQAKNVEFLIQKASFELLLLLHDDDLLMSNCLEALSKPLVKHPEVVASFGNQYFIEEDGKPIKQTIEWNAKYYRTPERAGIVDGEWASIVQMFPNDAFLVRTRIAQKIGYYGKGRGGDAVDFYFGFRLGKESKFFFLDEFTAKYRVCTESVTGSGSVHFMSSTLKILLEDLEKETLQNPEVRKKIRELMNPAISEAIKAGEKRTALRWIFSSNYNFFTPRGLKRLLMLAK